MTSRSLRSESIATSEELAGLFDEQDDAVKWMIRNVITEAHKSETKVGLCGQAPSDHPEFAEFLVTCGIDLMSVSPDSFIAVKHRVAAAEFEAGQRPYCSTNTWMRHNPSSSKVREF